MKERGDGVCGKGKGGGPPEKGAELCFQLSDDEENHQDTGMYFQTPVG